MLVIFKILETFNVSRFEDLKISGFQDFQICIIFKIEIFPKVENLETF